MLSASAQQMRRLMAQKIGAVDSYVDYDLEVPRLRLIEALERK